MPQKRLVPDEEEHFIYFITVKTGENIPFFRERLFCDLWIEELRLCKGMKGFRLYGFCLNYDHFHMLVEPTKEANISEIMHSLKRNFSRDANRVFFSEGEDPNPRLSGQGDDMDRHLQRLKDFLVSLRQKFLIKYGKTPLPLPKFSWQKSFHDHVIRDNDYDLENHWNYTVYNFSKHELPEDWLYTSLNFLDLIDEME